MESADPLEVNRYGISFKRQYWALAYATRRALNRHARRAGRHRPRVLARGMVDDHASNSSEYRLSSFELRLTQRSVAAAFGSQGCPFAQVDRRWNAVHSHQVAGSPARGEFHYKFL